MKQNLFRSKTSSTEYQEISECIKHIQIVCWWLMHVINDAVLKADY